MLFDKKYAIFAMLLSIPLSVTAKKRDLVDAAGEISNANVNAKYDAVDTYAYRTSKRPLFAPSWKGGYSRRFLRANMQPLIGSVVAQENLVSQMESMVNRFLSRKNIKITRDELEAAFADAMQDLARNAGDADYTPRTSFSDRRGTFLSGGADLAWDYFWGGGTVVVGWFRTNYRKKSTVDRRFAGLYRDLDRVLARVVKLKTKLQICFGKLGDFKDKDAIVEALKQVEFNAAKAAKVKESQQELQATYANGDAQIVPVWESFRDYTAVQMNYLQSLNGFVQKNFKNPYSALNRISALPKR